MISLDINILDLLDRISQYNDKLNTSGTESEIECLFSGASLMLKFDGISFDKKGMYLINKDCEKWLASYNNKDIVNIIEKLCTQRKLIVLLIHDKKDEKYENWFYLLILSNTVNIKAIYDSDLFNDYNLEECSTYPTMFSKYLSHEFPTFIYPPNRLEII